MAELTDHQIDLALERGAAATREEPRASAVRFDRKARRIVVDLRNGCSFAFPPALVPDLATAADADLATPEILGNGYGLHWEKLDVDISLPGLMAELSGTSTYLASRAGSARSSAKSAAARTNGLKGGRPRKAG